MIEVLFLEWDSFGKEYIVDAMKRCGCNITFYPWDFKNENMRENQKIQLNLEELIGKKTFHFVFSVNFFPIAAIACYGKGTKYVSWVYDSPFMLLYSKFIYCPTNYVFLFDYSQYRELAEYGVKTVYYLPLAADVDFYDTIQNKDGEEKYYKSDISFVGSTYSEKRQDFMKLLEGVNSYTKGYLNAIMNAQHEIHGSFIVESLINDRILEQLQKVCPIQKGDDEWETYEWIYANYFLARHITGWERKNVLDLLAQKYEVTLYTPDKELVIPNVINKGTVDYVDEMPLVFKNSKINLNITLRSIHSGIPLRAMDIMGNGGFLLTNYQEDFLNFFVPNEDYVYFTDEKDMLEKVEYYIENEEERKRIAKNGYEKVKKSHTYYHRILTILSIIFKEKELELFDTIQQLEVIRGKYPDTYWHQELSSYIKNYQQVSRQQTDKIFLCMEEERDSLFKLKEKFTCYINDLLEQRCLEAWQEIVIWFNRNYTKEMMAVFWEFNILLKFIEIFLEEMRSEKKISVFHFSSMEDIIQNFLYITFFLRRIEYGLEKEGEREMIEYFHSLNLSDIAYRHMIDNSQLFDKEKVKMYIKEMVEKYEN